MKRICIIIFLLWGLHGVQSLRAQKKVIPPVEQHLYQYDYNLTIKKFNREHIPLDGAEVPYIPFRKDELYGFVDKKTRKMVLQPLYKQVFAVYKEGAIVAGPDGYGLVDYKGKFLIYPSFRNLFKERGQYRGVISGIVDTTYPDEYNGSNGTFFFDSAGKFQFEISAHRQQDFMLDDTLAWFRFGPLYTVYNRRGDTLKQFLYKQDIRFCGIFNNVLVFETKEENKGYSVYTGFDIAGQTKFALPQSSGMEMVFRLNDTIYGAFSDGGLHLVSRQGEEYPFGILNGAVGFGFNHLLPYFYSLKFFVVQDPETKKYGLLSKQGKLQVPCTYHYLGTFLNGEIAYLDTVKRLIGFMDSNRNITVPPSLLPANADRMQLAGQALQYRDGLCLVYTGYRVTQSNGYGPNYALGYADRQGKVVLSLPDSIILAGPFSCGLAPVIAKGGKLGFIDKKGKLVIPLKYEAAVQGAYPFPEVVLPEFINGFAYLKAFKGYIDTSGYEYFSGTQVKDHYDFSH